MVNNIMDLLSMRMYAILNYKQEIHAEKLYTSNTNFKQITNQNTSGYQNNNNMNNSLVHQNNPDIRQGGQTNNVEK